MMNAAGLEDLLAPLRRRLDALEAENRALHDQLALAHREVRDLRRGVGLTVCVDGVVVAAGPVASQPEAAGQPVAARSPAPGSSAYAPPVLFPTARAMPPEPAPANPPPALFPAARPTAAEPLPQRHSNNPNYFLD